MEIVQVKSRLRKIQEALGSALSISNWDALIDKMDLVSLFLYNLDTELSDTLKETVLVPDQLENTTGYQIPNVFLRTKLIPEMENELGFEEQTASHDSKYRNALNAFEAESFKYDFTSRRKRPEKSSLDRKILERMIEWESKGK